MFQILETSMVLGILIIYGKVHPMGFHGILEKVEFILIGLAVYFLPFHPSNLDEGDVGEEEVHRDDETPTDALRTHSVYGRGCMACFALYCSVYLFKWTEIWCDAQQRPGARTRNDRWRI